MTYGDVQRALTSVNSSQTHAADFYGAMARRMSYEKPNEELLPEGYLLFESLFCSDMATGANLGEKDQRNKAIGLPPLVFRLLCRVLRKQFSKEIQEQIKTVEDELHKRLAK